MMYVGNDEWRGYSDPDPDLWVQLLVGALGYIEDMDVVVDRAEDERTAEATERDARRLVLARPVDREELALER